MTSTALAEVFVIVPARWADRRGFFSEVYSKDALAACGVRDRFVQDSHSLSTRPGTVRGLHFQRPPAAQAKLVRVVRGRAFDVVVDVRAGSPTFGRHVTVVLDAENWKQIYVPPGFAHGFCTLEPDTEVVYKSSAAFAPALEGGIRWSDPALAIDWPVAAENAILSDKDLGLPKLADVSPVVLNGSAASATASAAAAAAVAAP